MSYSEYLKELLLPLRVYDLDAPFNSGELDSAGLALDGVDYALEEVDRETNLTTAESWGLERIAQLVARRPVAESSEMMAEALAALLRIGGDSFTLASINDTISGCGIPAKVLEVDVGAVAVIFPGIPGVPEGFEQLKKIVEDILPPHLEIQYWLRYITWEELEESFPVWQQLEDTGLSWERLETYVSWS